jgi:hypothetical protein
MSPIFTTFMTSLLSTIGFPYLEKALHLSFHANEQTAITAGFVSTATAAAHWIHTRLSRPRRRRR